MEAEESDALLARLYAQAENPEYQCFFRYEAGSLAFWGKCSSSLRVFLGLKEAAKQAASTLPCRCSGIQR